GHRDREFVDALHRIAIASMKLEALARLDQHGRYAHSPLRVRRKRSELVRQGGRPGEKEEKEWQDGPAYPPADRSGRGSFSKGTTPQRSAHASYSAVISRTRSGSCDARS